MLTPIFGNIGLPNIWSLFRGRWWWSIKWTFIHTRFSRGRWNRWWWCWKQFSNTRNTRNSWILAVQTQVDREEHLPLHFQEDQVAGGSGIVDRKRIKQSFRYVEFEISI
jgi:hypothetical protein